jgi:hypothetical protein
MYAQNTTVPVEKTRGEIEQLLSRQKCTQSGTSVDYEANRARVQFKAKDRIVRFEITLPKRPAYSGPGSAMWRKYEQAERRIWRALLLVLKAKFEAIESGITVFEEEFLAQIVTSDNSTVGAHVLPMVTEMYTTGQLPAWDGGRALPARGATS